ncbi:glycosyltransferase family 9 protein [Methylocella sp.]|uniref:glycosyltransferase family 9 protein n=1 Tax=Methylocella sp. TaxID=1978226 RepID=UPI003784061A
MTYDASGLREMECVRLARSLRALGPIDLDDRRNWDLRLSPDEIEAGEKALEPFAGAPFVAINMGGKVVEKHWGDDNWRKLLADLAPTHGGYGLLFLGAGDESEGRRRGRGLAGRRGQRLRRARAARKRGRPAPRAPVRRP